MEIPRHWRKIPFMLNPNENGYRPDFFHNIKSQPIIDKKEQTGPKLSAQVTCPTFNGEPDSYALREVKPYSEIMHPEANVEESGQPIEIKFESGILYQSAEMTV